AVQGADDSFSPSQRLAIQGQIDAMVLEINDIVNETIFQGALLIDGNFIDKLFQTGAGAGDTFAVELGKANASAFTGFATDSVYNIQEGVNDKLFIFDDSASATVELTIAAGSYTGDELRIAITAAVGNTTGLVATYNAGTGEFTLTLSEATDQILFSSQSSTIGRLLGFDVTSDIVNTKTSDFAANALSVVSSSSAAAAMENVDAAIDTLNASAQTVGEFMIRLSSKEDNLAVAVTNTEAARSRIEDADFAKEQMDLVRAQIVQQTAFSSFAQANSAPQLILSLFR
ncbi:MAG: hypothetical protein IIB43_01480, partial [Candidatus Marinimicrobia bacterium]|nr:hypothetical protein [Candidatus Neomarinimicrobiota bacterium]